MHQRIPRDCRRLRRRRLLRRRARAMSLLEIMVVITLIGLVTAAIGVAVVGSADDARVSIAKQTAQEAGKSLEMYHLRHGRYPSTSEGFNALVNPGSGRPVLEELPTDPWGQPLIYLFPGKGRTGRPDVGSKGPDGVEGTDDDVWG